MRGQDYEVTANITLDQAYRGAEVELDLSVPEYDEQGFAHRVTRSFKARIPKGATDGQRLRIPGKGGKGFNGGREGDLYLNIVLEPHPLFRVSGHDLYIDLPLAPWEAVLGTRVELPTPGGPVQLKVPAGTHTGQHLRLGKRGLPTPRGGEGDRADRGTDRGQRAGARALQRARRALDVQSPCPFRTGDEPCESNSVKWSGWTSSAS